MIPAKVSILIAARNEEKNLPVLLESLNHLKYPKELLQILIGNDASTDNSQTLLEEFEIQNNHVTVINLAEPRAEEQFGKTRVLERLAREASGDYYFFTDADMELPRTWIEALLAGFEKNVGVVVGISTMKPLSFLATMQGLEWLTAIHFMHLLSNSNIETTGMGNNMAVSKDAYWATGGYAKIKFSIVEDYALYKAIIDSGYNFNQTYLPEALAFTKPPEKFFEQRKRWMRGVFESRSMLILPALIQAIFLPILIVLFILKFSTALFILSFLFLFYCIQIYIIERKLKLKGYLKNSAMFVLYMPISWFLQLINYLLPSKVVWKERRY